MPSIGPGVFLNGTQRDNSLANSFLNFGDYSYVREDYAQVVQPEKKVGSFTFANAEVRLVLPWQAPYVGSPDGRQRPSNVVRVPGLTLLTISEHCDKYAVTNLGTARIRGFTRGNRVTAGSMAFISTGDSAFQEALYRYVMYAGLPSNGEITPDQLPPFDLVSTMVSDVGDISTLRIRGIEIVDTSRTMGTTDVQLTEVYSYMAISATTHSFVFGETAQRVAN